MNNPDPVQVETNEKNPKNLTEVELKLQALIQSNQHETGQVGGLDIYDIIKVNIRDEHTGSQYILSRFLVSRMLSACNMDEYHSNKIAKDCKRRVVNEGKLDITTTELQRHLFKALKKKGYSSFIEKYQQINEFFQSRTPLFILISGTHLSLKTSVSNMCGDRLNIANIINTDLLKPLVNRHKDIKMPLNYWEYSLKEDFMDTFKMQSEEIWRGALMDILKVMDEGKPLMFEGEIALNKFIRSPFGPSEERFRAYKMYVESKQTIDQMSDSEIFDYFNKQNTGLCCNEFVVPEWASEGAMESEKLMIADLKKQIQKLDYKKIVILPIILVINKEDHLFLIKETLYQIYNSRKSELFTNHEEIDARSLEYLENFQKIQDRIVQENHGIVIPLRLVDNELTYNLIHTAFMMELNFLNPKKAF